MIKEYRKVKIIKTTSDSEWYNVGDIYDVLPYRHNSDEYWEIAGWDGKNNLGQKYWIIKNHAVEIEKFKMDVSWLDKMI